MDGTTPYSPDRDEPAHTGKPPLRRLLITVHGIRTYGHWQERLEQMIGDEIGPDSIRVVNYKYGYFSILAFIIPIFRWLVTRRFRAELVSWCGLENWSRIDLVGHSFGTHMLAWALHGIPTDKRPKIHTIVLAGSVLRGSFPWRDLVGSCVERVVNDCGSKDNVLVINQVAVLFTGMAGRAGFSGATHGRFRNRFFVFGHSGYFIDDQTRPDDKWMRQYWLPMLTGTGSIYPYDGRPPPSWIDGIIQTLANNAEPIKLVVYVTPVAVATLWIWGLYTGEKEARQNAEQRHSIILANTGSEFLRRGDESRAVAYLSSALELHPTYTVPADLLFTTMTQRAPVWRLMSLQEGETELRTRDLSFGFVPDKATPTSKTKDDGDNGDDNPISQMTLTAPDGEWRLVLSYDRGDERIAEPYRYTIDGTRLPAYAEIVGMTFDENSQYLAIVLDGRCQAIRGCVWIASRDSTAEVIIEHPKVHTAGFAEQGTLAYTISDHEVRFRRLKGDGPVPPTMRLDTAAGYLELARENASWLATLKHSNSISVWSFPMSSFPSWSSKELKDSDERHFTFSNWDDQSKIANNGTRIEEVYMSSGEWKVVAPPSNKSRWPVLTHKLSKEDRNEKFLQGEGSFQATTALIIENAAISGDATTVVTTAGRSNPRIWRAGSSTPHGTLQNSNKRYVEGVKIDSTGQTAFVLFSADKENPEVTFSVFSIRDGQRIGGGTLVQDVDSLLNVSSDCRKIIVLKSGSTVEVRDATNDQAVGAPIHFDGNPKAAISDDASRIATVSDKGQVQVWHLETGLLLSVPPNPRWSARGAFGLPWFSEDGRSINVVQLGQEQRIVSWQIRLPLTKDEAKLFAEFSRHYYGVRLSDNAMFQFTHRKPAAEILAPLRSKRDSEFSKLAHQLYRDAIPRKD